MLSIYIYASINYRSYSLNTPLAWSASPLPNNLLGIDELSAVYRRSKQRAVIDTTTPTTPTTTTPTTDATYAATPLTDRSKITRLLSSSSSSSRIIRYYSNDKSAESNDTSDDDSRSSNSNSSSRRRRSDEKTQQSDRLDGMTVCLIALDEGFRELQAL